VRPDLIVVVSPERQLAASIVQAVGPFLSSFNENNRLKRMLPDTMLDNAALKDLAT